MKLEATVHRGNLPASLNSIELSSHWNNIRQRDAAEVFFLHSLCLGEYALELAERVNQARIVAANTSQQVHVAFHGRDQGDANPIDLTCSFPRAPSTNLDGESSLMKSTMTALLLTACLSTPALAEIQKHDFKGAATAEIYKKASGDDLWIYRFDPMDYDTKKDKRPAVVFFFGGGWNGGKVTQFEQHAKYLAARGMVTFAADYRVKSRQQSAPDACVADGKSAIRWIRKNAGRLGIDPDRIAAGGGSAGGHVAATTGICDGMDDPAENDSKVSSKANALLLFNPVYDNGPDGYGHDRVKTWFPAISPAHNITKDDPPTIVFFGSEDPLVPVSTAKKFDSDLRAVGVKSEVWIYEGQPHGFFNESKSQESFLDTVLKTDAFLVSLGWIKGTADETKLKSLLKKQSL